MLKDKTGKMAKVRKRNGPRQKKVKIILLCKTETQYIFFQIAELHDRIIKFVDCVFFTWFVTSERYKDSRRLKTFFDLVFTQLRNRHKTQSELK